MKTAIVTGATGFIGTHLVFELVSRGVEVVAITRKNSPNLARLPKGVTVVDCAMDEYDKLPKLLAGMSLAEKDFDVFYHLAWDGATGDGRGDAALQTRNALCTLAAVCAANELDCGKFVAAGTVYENFAGQIAGSDIFRNTAFYVLSKKYAGDMARQSALKLGLPFVLCSFCHPVGKYMKKEQMLASVIKRLISGHPVDFGEGKEPYDIIAALDLAHGLYLAGEIPLVRQEYFIGSGTPRKLKEYLEAAKSVLSVDTPINFGAKADDGMRFDARWFDTEPFARETGFKAKTSFDDAVRRTAEFLGGM